MNLLRYKATVTNLLISFGAYYLSRWLVGPLAFVWGKFTNGIIYRGDLAGWVVLPLVVKVPEAVTAAAVGVSIVWLVQSSRRVAWPILPALLYAVFGFLGYHWARPPLPLDRVSQAINALFPAITCIVGGMLAARQLKSPHDTQKTPA